MKKPYKKLDLEVIAFEEDILCNSGEVFDEANGKDNYFQDVWD